MDFREISLTTSFGGPPRGRNAPGSAGANAEDRSPPFVVFCGRISSMLMEFKNGIYLYINWVLIQWNFIRCIMETSSCPSNHPYRLPVLGTSPLGADMRRPSFYVCWLFVGAAMMGPYPLKRAPYTLKERTTKISRQTGVGQVVATPLKYLVHHKFQLHHFISSKTSCPS